MPSNFSNSTFYDLIKKKTHSATPMAVLGGMYTSTFSIDQRIEDAPLVVFDFETTGLDSKNNRIIEIGAIKYKKWKEVARYSVLVNPGHVITEEITRITGITQQMVDGEPSIDTLLVGFHEFMMGCLCVAHNAEFDVGFLVHESARMGIDTNYTVICSLKIARQYAKSDRKSLDALANHYGFHFNSRHRSLGDIEVTAEVFKRLIQDNKLETIKDVKDFLIDVKEIKR